MYGVLPSSRESKYACTRSCSTAASSSAGVCSSCAISFTTATSRPEKARAVFTGRVGCAAAVAPAPATAEAHALASSSSLPFSSAVPQRNPRAQSSPQEWPAEAQRRRRARSAAEAERSASARNCSDNGAVTFAATAVGGVARLVAATGVRTALASADSSCQPRLRAFSCRVPGLLVSRLPAVVVVSCACLLSLSPHLPERAHVTGKPEV